MQMQSVTSSNIRSVGYENGTLRIMFNNGRIYEYDNVPEETYKELMSSDSIGRYYNQNIKGQYEGTQV